MPIHILRVSSAMARLALALFLFCFVSLHAGLGLSMAGVEQTTVALLDIEDKTGEDNAGIPAAVPEAGASCHDACEWHETTCESDLPSRPLARLGTYESSMLCGQITLELRPPR